MDEKRVRKAIAFFGRKIYEFGELEEQTDGVLIHNIEYYLTAIEALEKQIPKKPNDISSVFDNNEYFGDIGKCPCCNAVVDDGIMVCDCGQKIKWSE